MTATRDEAAPGSGATAGFDTDVLVVGSGFGGSVSALRLTEKGYRVTVAEAGRRFADDELPKTSWHLRDFLWAPKVGLKGIQRIHRLHDVLVLAGAGVGGGSLVYANTLYVPPQEFFDDPQWSHITDWADELRPFYDQATRMLGVVRNPSFTPADAVMRDVAEQMGAGHTFTLTPVGVFFGDGPGVRSPDPFFGGAGPERTGCIECGGCMSGCRYGAKNTLVKNYLHLAERAGARVLPETTVTRLRERPGGGWLVDVEQTRALWQRPRRRTLTAQQVVVAAGTYGTQRLLHRLKADGDLPRLSDRLGVLTRTNSESILGATVPKPDPARDFTRGVAITSSFHPEPYTHIEPCRYAKGSNAMGLLSTVLTDGEGRTPRWVKAARLAARRPIRFARDMSPRRWSERTIVLLVMQSLDNSITVRFRRSRLGRRRLTTEHGHGEPSPSWIPAGNEAAHRAAHVIGGEPGGNWGDVTGATMTAHFLGGATIGESPETGVVDAYHRAWGHPTLHVVDGSTVTANLGVNPSLTITAQAERAMSLWPNRGEVDQRPAQGEPYRRVAPVAPKNPTVPEHAPGALRLPRVRETETA